MPVIPAIQEAYIRGLLQSKATSGKSARPYPKIIPKKKIGIRIDSVFY
jgi:hypothetical protein